MLLWRPLSRIFQFDASMLTVNKYRYRVANYWHVKLSSLHWVEYYPSGTLQQPSWRLQLQGIISSLSSLVPRVGKDTLLIILLEKRQQSEQDLFYTVWSGHTCYSSMYRNQLSILSLAYGHNVKLAILHTAMFTYSIDSRPFAPAGSGWFCQFFFGTLK